MHEILRILLALESNSFSWIKFSLHEIFAMYGTYIHCTHRIWVVVLQHSHCCLGNLHHVLSGRQLLKEPHYRLKVAGQTRLLL